MNLNDLKIAARLKAKKEFGGDGSGNFDHEGVPGHRGGSAKRGGGGQNRAKRILEVGRDPYVVINDRSQASKKIKEIRTHVGRLLEKGHITQKEHDETYGELKKLWNDVVSTRSPYLSEGRRFDKQGVTNKLIEITKRVGYQYTEKGMQDTGDPEEIKKDVEDKAMEEDFVKGGMDRERAKRIATIHRKNKEQRAKKIESPSYGGKQTKRPQPEHKFKDSIGGDASNYRG